MNVEGLISGLNVSNILDQIAAIRRRPITVLESRQQELRDQLSLYQSLEKAVLSLQTAAQTLASSATFEARRVTVTGSQTVAAAADPGAALGVYSITVNQLAQAQKISSASFSAANQACGLEGDFLLNGRVVHVQAGDDLLSIAAAINRANARVQATVLRVGDNDYRLVLSGLDTGAQKALDLVDANASSLLVSLGLVDSSAILKHPIANGAVSDLMAASLTPVGELLGLQAAPHGTVQINGTEVSLDLRVDSLQDIADRITALVNGVTAEVETVPDRGAVRYRLRLTGEGDTPVFADSNNLLATLGILTKPVAHEMRAAQDAEVVIDGQRITSPTNSLDEVVPGLHLQLLAADPATPAAVTVSEDLEVAVQAVQELVSQYNAVVDLIAANQRFDPQTGTGGAFMSNYDVLLLEEQLRHAATYPLQGLPGLTKLLSQVGITTDKKDHLVLDEGALRAALAKDARAVQQLFTVTAESSSPYVSYVGSTTATRPSGPAGYAVVITQPATRARAESAALPEGIVRDEILTFYGQWQVLLSAGMSLAEAAKRINALSAQRGLGLAATVEGDKLVIEHTLYGSGYNIALSSSLDRGAGGTDLGGPQAGQQALYSGTDVAGTIGGEPATGRGQYLTGNNSNTNTAGLRLRITAPSAGNYGPLYLAEGVAQRLLDVIARLEDPSRGFFARTAQGLNERIKAVQDNIDVMQQRLQAYLDQMRRKFLALEEALGQAQALSQYITNQLEGLRNQYRSGGGG
jgi:flagellar hook-associated protein 2